MNSEQMSIDQLLREVESTPSKPFVPFALYNPLGDTLELYLKPNRFVSERVNDLFTIFVDRKDPEVVVGVAIKEIAKNLGPSLGPCGFRVSAARAAVRIEWLVLNAQIGRLWRFNREAAIQTQLGPPIPEIINRLLSESGGAEVTVANPKELEDALAACSS